MTYDNSTKTLLLADRAGSFAGMLKDRKFNIIFVDPAHGAGIDIQAKKSKMISYSGKTLQVKLK